MLACGDDGGGKGDRDQDSGSDEGAGGSAGSGGSNAGSGGGGGRDDGGNSMGDDAGLDAGPDGSFPPPFLEGGVYADAQAEDAGPPPEHWTCPDALWNDGICDCGCSATDFDCNQVTNCVTPGCVLDSCGACFTADGSWKSCAPAPDPSAWTCIDPIGDPACDCGCGIPDPDCQGNGCEHPGCYKAGWCDSRNGCGAGVTDAADDCNGIPPSILSGAAWDCPDGNYGAGDGCDCGCGVIDPDCGGLGCTEPRCFESACTTCHDEVGRPYACAAAEAGWDTQIIEAAGSNPSQCNAARFGADDGCDCGCGGHDPDCGDEGCDEPGCHLGQDEPACVRCTDGSTLQPSGCAPVIWTDGSHDCNPDNYGTGDGCDCGCGTPDPDCGAGGCTTPGCTDITCDVCNDGAGFYVECDGWTCDDAAAMTTSDCDCGCGVIDPACREFERESCTDSGCETAVCQFCNEEDGDRSACGGQWDGANCGSPSSQKYFGQDGLCDCGCGASDPDCEELGGCTEAGCAAPGCEVCHLGNQLVACPFWTCAAEAFGDGETCDCGCGAPDPDCGVGGCEVPGCGDPSSSCEVCHDPYGRAVDCS